MNTDIQRKNLVAQPFSDGPTAEPARPAPKRKYVRRTITAGPGTALVVEQEQRLFDARNLKVVLNTIATLSEWGLEHVADAVAARRSVLTEAKAP